MLELYDYLKSERKNIVDFIQKRYIPANIADEDLFNSIATELQKYSVGNWYDERLKITRPPHLAFRLVNKNHCPTCQTITERDFSDTSLRIKRRKHLLYYFDIRASGICNAIKGKRVKAHMMNVLGNSEFAGFKEYLLNQ